PMMPPIEGEEFGYVLRGQVTLFLGKRSHLVKKGSSFCLHPSATHYFENTSAKPATVLWVSTPPSF
ncbi:MAG: cupin domain-containing protein, partial [Clostridia bacterium]